MADTRPSARTRLYDSQWDRERKEHLANEPLCRPCKAHGKQTKATVVDHIKPHNRDPHLFKDPANRQALCTRCHADKRAYEATGKQQYSGGTVNKGCSQNGSPTDPAHPWNQRDNRSGPVERQNVCGGRGS